MAQSNPKPIEPPLKFGISPGTEKVQLSPSTIEKGFSPGGPDHREFNTVISNLSDYAVHYSGIQMKNWEQSYLTPPTDSTFIGAPLASESGTIVPFRETSGAVGMLYGRGKNPCRYEAISFPAGFAALTVGDWQFAGGAVNGDKWIVLFPYRLTGTNDHTIYGMSSDGGQTWTALSDPDVWYTSCTYNKDNDSWFFYDSISGNVTYLSDSDFGNTIASGTTFAGTATNVEAPAGGNDVQYNYNQLASCGTSLVLLLSEIEPTSNQPFGSTWRAALNSSGVPSGPLSQASAEQGDVCLYCDRNGHYWATDQASAVGQDDGLIWRSVNQGLNWTSFDIPSATPGKFNFCFASDGGGTWAYQDLGDIYVSCDQGSTWEKCYTQCLFNGFNASVLQYLDGAFVYTSWNPSEAIISRSVSL